MNTFYLEIPHINHKQEYERVMDRWELLEENIQPELMRRGKTPLLSGLNIAKMIVQQGRCYRRTYHVHCILC